MDRIGVAAEVNLNGGIGSSIAVKYLPSLRDPINRQLAARGLR
jgi:hypothetical protein